MCYTLLLPPFLPLLLLVPLLLPVVGLVHTRSELVSPIGGDLGWSLFLGACRRLDVTLSPACHLLPDVVQERVDIASDSLARTVQNVPPALDLVAEGCNEQRILRDRWVTYRSPLGHRPSRR